MNFTRQLTILAGCFLVAILSGCDAGSPKAKLIGKWELDIEAMMKMVEDEAKTEQDKMGLQFAKAMFKDMKMHMEFKSDGTAVMTMKAMGQEQSDEGKYEIKSTEGDTIVVSITDTKKKGPGEMKITFIDKNTIEISDPTAKSKQMQKMKMKRVQ